ncbi:MAG: IS3 family transposase [Sedimentisphaerales bacterium]
MKTRPLTIILTMLAGWINRHQQDIIEYLKAENAILKNKLGKKRIILTDQQRITLAVLAKKIGRKGLSEICSVFSPDTLLKWHRKLIAQKYDGSKNRKFGRPQISDELRNIIIKVAKANRGWGYPRIQGQLKYLGYKVCPKTIANILKKEGLEPQPDRQRKTTWAKFIKSHWQSLTAIDFFTSEIYTFKGLTRYMVLVAIDYSIRSIKYECLNRMLIFGQAHLRHCINEYVAHYHQERAHQSLDNTIIDPPPNGRGEIVCHERLGGLLKFYRRAA